MKKNFVNRHLLSIDGDDFTLGEIAMSILASLAFMVLMFFAAWIAA